MESSSVNSYCVAKIPGGHSQRDSRTHGHSFRSKNADDPVSKPDRAYSYQTHKAAAWLSYFADDGNAKHFAKSIESLDELLVPSITLTEVFKAIVRQCDEEVAFEAIAHMQQGQVIDLDSAIVIGAASCGIEFNLPLVDSIIYAIARKCDAAIWTQDADFKGLKGVRFFPKSKWKL